MSNEIAAANTWPARPLHELAPFANAASSGIDKRQEVSASEDVKASADQRPDTGASRQELQETIDRLNEQLRKSNYNLSFSMHQASRHVVVKVRDTQSGEVIRQIPSETVLRFAEQMHDLKGLLKDEKI